MKSKKKNIMLKIIKIFNFNNWQSTSSPSFYYGWFSKKQQNMLRQGINKNKTKIDYHICETFDGNFIKITCMSRKLSDCPEFDDVKYIGVVKCLH